MKFIIWFLCFFFFVFLQVIIKNMGIIIGGIPMMILCTLFYYLGNGLCRVWDKRPEAKSKMTAQKPSTSNPRSANSAPHTARNQQRFCKLCGSPIDPTTKKCAGCGKQYFHVSHLKSTLVYLTGIILIAALLFSIYEISICHQEIEELTTIVSEFEEEKESQYNKGYESGKNIGYHHGYEDGRKDGYDLGYATASGTDNLSNVIKEIEEKYDIDLN